MLMQRLGQLLTWAADKLGCEKHEITRSWTDDPYLTRWMLWGTRYPAKPERGAMLHRLVLHEYLWVIGLNDENYRISSRLEPLNLAPILAGDLKRDICREN